MDNTSPTSLPPPYRSHKRRQLRTCFVCDNREPPQKTVWVQPYLIHKQNPHLLSICACSQKAHAVCLKGGKIKCNLCNKTYHRRFRFTLARIACIVTHILSLASVVGLVFGLAELGRALDQLGLGNQAGAKLDGDDTWHDTEMAQISAWLNMVHYVTGWAGEALLGLVYLIGQCGVIGLDRTLAMLHCILGIDLCKINHPRFPHWFSSFTLYACLGLLGLTLGTYLLLYSWFWACIMHLVCQRILNVRASPASTAVDSV